MLITGLDWYMVEWNTGMWLKVTADAIFLNGDYMALKDQT